MRTMLVVIVCLLIGDVTRGEEQRRSVTVNGQSAFRIEPDEAIVGFSASSKDAKLIRAKAANDLVTTEIAKAVKALEIPAEEFKVTDLRIGPYEEGKFSRTGGYQVIRSFEIRTTDFSKIDKIIAAIVDAGGDGLSIHRLKLQVRDEQKHQMEARRQAVEDAKEIASHLAELTAMKLGRVISITERTEYNSLRGMLGNLEEYSAIDDLSPRNSRVAATLEFTPPTHTKLLLVSAEEKEAAQPASKQQKDPQPNEILLSAGQVGLNALVTIEFELVPKE